MVGMIGDLFAERPVQFGLRGDPELWDALGRRSVETPMPTTRGALDGVVRSAFADEVGVPLTTPHHQAVFVERFARGGMSSGQVSVPWWRATALGIVLDRAGLPGARFSVRTTVEDDWPLVRQTRIENATDNPVSYGATLTTTLGMTEDDWRLRARRGAARDATSVVATDDDTGRWIGMMGAQMEDGPLLTGVWVAPEFRGRGNGVAEVLFAEVLAWVRARGDSVTLWVDEGSAGAAARNFYDRHGFTATGRRRPIGFAPGDSIEMVLVIRGAAGAERLGAAGPESR